MISGGPEHWRVCFLQGQSFDVELHNNVSISMVRIVAYISHYQHGTGRGAMDYNNRMGQNASLKEMERREEVLMVAQTQTAQLRRNTRNFGPTKGTKRKTSTIILLFM